MKLSQKQIDAVTTLSAEKRFKHSIKLVADWQLVWGLYRGDWVLFESHSSDLIFRLWPAKEYAELCAANEKESKRPVNPS